MRFAEHKADFQIQQFCAMHRNQIIKLLWFSWCFLSVVLSIWLCIKVIVRLVWVYFCCRFVLHLFCPFWLSDLWGTVFFSTLCVLAMYQSCLSISACWNRCLHGLCSPWQGVSSDKQERLTLTLTKDSKTPGKHTRTQTPKCSLKPAQYTSECNRLKTNLQ